MAPGRRTGPQPPTPTPPPFTRLLLLTPDPAIPPAAAYDAVCTAVEAVCGPATGAWSAEVAVWRRAAEEEPPSPAREVAVVTVNGDPDPAVHLVCAGARSVLAVDSPSAATMITAFAGLARATRLALDGPSHAAGDVAARVGRCAARRGDPPRGVCVQVELSAAADLAEAAPALADFCGALTAAAAASGAGDLAPLPVPLSEYALPRSAASSGPADAVLWAHLTAAVLGGGKVGEGEG